MCIICVKPSNTDFPSKALMKTCFENNSDGAGFAFPADGVVNIHKGYMSFKKFWRAFRRFELDKSVPVVFHFRIATSAGVNRPCTHPFPITHDYKSLQALTCQTDLAIAHNGVLRNVTPTKTLSDTMVFIRDYLSVVKADLLQSDTVRVAIEKFTSGSKFAVLAGDGDLLMIGSGWIQDKGLYFSNDTYEEDCFNWRKWYNDYSDLDTKAAESWVEDSNGEWHKVYGSNTCGSDDSFRRSASSSQAMTSSVPCPQCDGEMLIYNENGVVYYHCLACEDWFLDEDIDRRWKERQADTGERAWCVTGRTDW